MSIDYIGPEALFLLRIVNDSSKEGDVILNGTRADWNNMHRAASSVSGFFVLTVLFLGLPLSLIRIFCYDE